MDLTWEELVNDHQYGDIETREGFTLFRGPIKEIRIDGDEIVIVPEWLAMRSVVGPQNNDWTLVNDPQAFRTSLKARPMVTREERIVIDLPPIVTAVIYPKTNQRLDPRRVRGHALHDSGFFPRPTSS